MKKHPKPQSVKASSIAELPIAPVIEPDEPSHTVLNLLRSYLHESRNRAAEIHEQSLNGIEACAYQSAVMDTVLMVLWKRYFERSGITRDIALFALGGYGRQELNPASDIDLLFATRDGFPPPLEESVTKMMQLLWDLHLDLGHSTRSLDECLDAVSDRQSSGHLGT